MSGVNSETGSVKNSINIFNKKKLEDKVGITSTPLSITSTPLKRNIFEKDRNLISDDNS